MPGFNIQEFQSEINKRPVLKPTRFNITCPMPQGLLPYTDQLMMPKDLSFYAEGAAIPDVIMATSNILRYGYGPTEKRPFNVAYGDLPFSFRGDSDGRVFQFLRSWLRLSFQPYLGSTGGLNDLTGLSLFQCPFEAAYKADYAVDMYITQYSDRGDPVVTTLLREAFPIFVAQQPLNWGARGDYTRIPITLSFFDWRLAPGKPKAPADVSQIRGS